LGANVARRSSSPRIICLKINASSIGRIFLGQVKHLKAKVFLDSQ